MSRVGRDQRRTVVANTGLSLLNLDDQRGELVQVMAADVGFSLVTGQLLLVSARQNQSLPIAWAQKKHQTCMRA
jgi:hypothetical protein